MIAPTPTTTRLADVTPEAPGRYERRGVLGVGGIGFVELAWDHHLGREVALKRLRPGLGGDAVRRFLKEARVGALLAHPGIVPVYELGRRADGALYYTMLRIRGRTLAQALDGADLADRLALLPHLIAVCQAVAYAHERGVVHRDLKPDNVMLGDFGETLVVDWGLCCERGGEAGQDQPLIEALAALRHASGTQTVAGAPIGTPAYMPPEQARGDLAAIDERADVYALGAILYELLTGEAPFSGPSALHILTLVLSEPPLPPRSLEPQAPAELCAITARALAKDPAARYANASALCNDLLAFQAGRRVEAHAYGRGQLVSRWLWRRRVALLGAAAVLAAGVGAGWYRGRADAHPPAPVVDAGRLDAALRAGGPRGPAAARLLGPLDAATEARLRRVLVEGDAAARAVAATALAAGDAESGAALEARLLAERDDAVRVALAEAIAARGGPTTTAALCAARPTAPPPLRRALDALLARLGPGPLPADAAAARDRAACLGAALPAAAAVEATEALRARHPDDAGLRLAAARALARAGDAVAALALADGPDADAVRALLLDREDLDAALAALDRLPPSAETLLLRARARHTLADAEGARQAAQAAAAQAHDADAARALAGVWLLLDDPAAAARVLADVLAGDPEDAAALRLRARALLRLGDATGARVAAERAHHLAPRDAAGRRLLAALRLADGDDAAGRALLTDAADRAVLALAPAGDLASALQALDAAAQAASPAARPALELMALVVALRLEGSGRLAARAAALSADGPWSRDLGLVIRGEASPAVLGGRLRQHPARACEETLALSARAYLAGIGWGAADRLAQARGGDPDELPCALARSLGRRTLLVQGTKP